MATPAARSVSRIRDFMVKLRRAVETEPNLFKITLPPLLPSLPLLLCLLILPSLPLQLLPFPTGWLLLLLLLRPGSCAKNLRMLLLLTSVRQSVGRFVRARRRQLNFGGVGSVGVSGGSSTSENKREAGGGLSMRVHYRADGCSDGKVVRGNVEKTKNNNKQQKTKPS